MKHTAGAVRMTLTSRASIHRLPTICSLLLCVAWARQAAPRRTSSFPGLKQPSSKMFTSRNRRGASSTPPSAAALLARCFPFSLSVSSACDRRGL
jgi:hypothetical protein